MIRAANCRALAPLLVGLALGCAAAGPERFPIRDPLWRDRDRQPFEGPPEEYFSPFAWDGADQLVFRPVTRFFAVDPAGEAVNVNALDEVPDSSFFTNRLSRHRLSTRQVALGPCDDDVAPPAPWRVTGAKPNGANPGFIIEDAVGASHLVKFDGKKQGPRATSADVVVSKLYHAAGYFVPCNRVVALDPDTLEIAPDALGETESGEKVPVTRAQIDRILAKGIRLADGRYRASTSRFVPGKPLGPFRYQSTRSDDPNDIIDHEDRRELRGMVVLAAWTNHFDSREQNTLDTWIEVDEVRGYVRHHVIDFGDCFGSVWEPPRFGRRLGHAYYFDFGQTLEDWFTLGLIDYPWETARFGKTGAVLGYYDVERFEPEAWKPGYPNPAFGRASEHDKAWMARILAELTRAQLEAAVAEAKLEDLAVEHELLRILEGRRKRILETYLRRLSPLGRPRVEKPGPGPSSSGELCVTDLATYSGVIHTQQRRYQVQAYAADDGLASRVPAFHRRGHDICVALDSLGKARANDAYWIVDLHARGGFDNYPVRLHVYRDDKMGFRLLGLERPSSNAAPQ